MTLDRLVINKQRPATSADLIALVDTFPGELDTGPALPLDRAAVQPTADGDEAELAGPVPGELDETWLDQVDRVAVSSAHFHDPPLTDQPHCRLRNTSCHEASE